MELPKVRFQLKFGVKYCFTSATFFLPVFGIIGGLDGPALHYLQILPAALGAREGVQIQGNAHGALPVQHGIQYSRNFQ